MGIFGLFKNKEVEKLKAQVEQYERNYENLINTDVFRSTYQYVSQGNPIYNDQSPERVLNDAYLENVDVFSIVDKIFRMSTNAKLKVYERDEEGKLVPYTGTNVDYYNRFLQRPSSQMSFSELLQFYFQSKLVLGNFFLNAVRYEKGKKKGLTSQVIPLYAPYVTVITSSDYTFPVSGYSYSWDTQIELDYNDVSHVKYANPKYLYNGQFYGLSPMRIALSVAQKQNNINTTERDQVGRGGPRHLLFKDQTGSTGLASAQNKDEIKDSFYKYQSQGRNDSPLVGFPLGKIDLDQSASDMGLIESSQDGLRKLCNVLSFPSQLMNDNVNSTYNNVSEMRKSAWTDCIQGHLTDFAHAYTSMIITEEDRENNVCFAWDYSQVNELAEDLNKVVDAYTKAKATPNELREKVRISTY